MSFTTLLNHYRTISFNERDKGDRFKREIQAYLLTEFINDYRFKKLWLLSEFRGNQRPAGGISKTERCKIFGSSFN